MQVEVPLQHYFKDYPSLLHGLRKLDITELTDFQEQLLGIDVEITNAVISAPEGSGKCLGIILLMLKEFVNEQQSTLMFIVHSKELSQKISHLLSSLTKIPITNLFMQNLQQSNLSAPKNILIGSPIQFEGLSKQNKDKVADIVIVETQFLLTFGYKESLYRLIGTFSKAAHYKILCATRNSDVEQLKSKYFSKVIKIDYQSPEQMKQQHKEKVSGQKSEAQCIHFYEVNEEMMIPISLYVTLKFNLVNPKVLVLCEDVKQVYRQYMILERCKIKGISLYNHENPLSLKFYTLSTWMSGSTNIMIATKQLLVDIDQNIFKQMVKKAYKKKEFQLNNLSTIITLNLSYIQPSFYQTLFDSFPHKPFIMNFIQNSEKQISALHQIIKYQEQNYKSVKSKQLPITKKQLQGFKYRVGDVVNSIGRRRVQQFMELDLKRKILKSPDLKQYFVQNPKEKEVLVKTINSISKKLQNGKITISEFIPSYLVPECLKTAYEEQLKNTPKAQSPAYQQKVSKVLRYIDPQQENPQTTDISRLRLISARKRWKLQHGFKLKKRNLRNEKKGIFES